MERTLVTGVVHANHPVRKVFAPFLFELLEKSLCVLRTTHSSPMP